MSKRAEGGFLEVAVSVRNERGKIELFGLVLEYICK